MINSTNPLRWFERVWFGPLLVALVTLLAVILTLDPGQSWSWSAAGPGVTLDESFNVQMGVFLTRAFAEFGLAMLDPVALQEVFSVEGYNPDHPPLGRLWLGVFHQFALHWLPATGVDPPFVTLYSRVGSAVAFSLTVFVIGLFTGRHYGVVAGAVAAGGLACLPRLFGHAHLAALESVLNLAWAVAVLGVAHFWTRPEHPSSKVAFTTGACLGLVALTKIQFVLLPPVVMGWAVWHWRHRALKPVAIWALAGACIFFAGWPWLWLKVPDHLLTFLGRSTDRVVLKCFYFGTTYIDREVPWHYPWVLFLATLPLGLLILGGLGLAISKRELVTDKKRSLILLSMLAPLVLFSSSVAVYDGERLFLPSFMGWAVFVGIGGDRLHQWLKSRVRQPTLAMSFCLLLSASELVLNAPYWLSYYGPLVGGLPGAAALGLEVDYWSQSFSRPLWSMVGTHVPEGERIAIAPVMHQFYVRELQSQNSQVRDHGWRLEPFDSRYSTAKFLLTFERRADRQSDEELRSVGFQVVEHLASQTVPLATLWQR